jgi:hypothetical protein
MCAVDDEPGAGISANPAPANHAPTSGVPVGAAPTSVAEALRLIDMSLDYLNCAAAGDLDGPGCGAALVALAQVQAKLAGARVRLLRRFAAVKGYEADGYASASPWLTARAGLTGKAARAQVRQARRLGERPDLEAAMATAVLTEPQAGEIAEWTRELPGEMRAATDKIIVAAAEAGAPLEDLAVIAAAAIEQHRRQRPDPDEDESRFGERYLRVGVTFGGAAVIRGDLTPECAAAVRAVLESLGKKRGPEDDRTEPQRFHDALQEGCELLLRARLTPDRAGADTQVVAHVPLSQLRHMPGAGDLEDAWLRARLGEDGYLSGKDAETAACDAQTVPVVTGTVDDTVIDQMIDLARALAEATAPGHVVTATSADLGLASIGNVSITSVSDAKNTTAGHLGQACGRPNVLSCDAWRILRHEMARLAVNLVSGPSGVAAVLRRGLLGQPYNTPSLPLDIGYSNSIPGHIRRAVQLRDRSCAWPRCGRPAAQCDVHHLRHQADGGETSVENCVLVCQFHHDVCIHRRGWRLLLHPDGTTEARSPDGRQILHSHAPPTENAA